MLITIVRTYAFFFMYISFTKRQRKPDTLALWINFKLCWLQFTTIRYPYPFLNRIHYWRTSEFTEKLCTYRIRSFNGLSWPFLFGCCIKFWSVHREVLKYSTPFRMSYYMPSPHKNWAAAWTKSITLWCYNDIWYEKSILLKFTFLTKISWNWRI